MAGQLSEFQKLLKSIEDGLVGFADGLIAKGYGSEARLRAASREGLLSVEGLEQGDADLIISHFKQGAHSQEAEPSFGTLCLLSGNETGSRLNIYPCGAAKLRLATRGCSYTAT